MTRVEFLKMLWPPIFLPLLFGVKVQETTTWEYHLELVSVYNKGDLPTILRKRGLEGWELCIRNRNEANLDELIFKRKA